MRFLNFIVLTLAVFSLSAACKQQTSSNNSNRANVANSNSNQTTTATNNANNANATAKSEIPVYGYEVVKTYKHDPKAFTEGLFFRNGFLYESVGREGESDLRKVEIETGDIKQRRKMDKQYFGEGTTELNGKVYQLTYTTGVCFVYDFNTFEPIKQFRYNFGEGWGMTNDGTNLIVSDGSHIVRFLDPNTFQQVRTITITNNGKPQYNVNELEWIKGEIWANIWHSEDPQILGKENYIARIDPNTGKIIGWIDLGGISPEDVARDTENTLNGIAYDAENDRIFVTGKQWKKLFEIKIKPKNS